MSRFITYYAKCRYAECRYAECHYAECRGALYIVSKIATAIQLFGITSKRPMTLHQKTFCKMTFY